MIGTLIKSERIKQSMKQNVLAKGICSPSYLCKIENNQVEPSEEMLELLLKRLAINIDLISTGINNEVYQEMLFSIYKEVVYKRSIPLAEEKLKYLQINQSNYLSKELFYNYKLLQLYLLLILKKETKNEIKLHLELLSENEKIFNREQLYLYYKCLGIYFYNNNKLIHADEAFEKANKYLPLEKLGEYEKADLAYMNSLVKLANNKFIQSIEILYYPKKYFINKVDLSRFVECLLIEGISYQKLKDLEKARDIYIQALKLTESTEKSNLSALIYQNLGSVNSSLNNLEESLDYYLKSYEMKASIEKQFITILSIIQIYSKLKDFTAMEVWINKGLSMTENRENFRLYFFHFKIYHYLITQSEDLKFINEALNFFESRKDFRHVYKYGIKIAGLLKNKQKYKLATEYYERAILIKNRDFIYWEDL